MNTWPEYVRFGKILKAAPNGAAFTVVEDSWRDQRLETNLVSTKVLIRYNEVG